MRIRTKVWAVIAILLIVFGATAFAAVMTVYRWDFTKLNTVKYENNVYEISQDFYNVTVKTKTADVSFALSDDGICRVSCYELENVKHAVSVQDGSLLIEVVDERKWYDHIGITFGAPQIIVYLPEELYGSLCVQTSTGDIWLEHVLAASLDLSVSTGKVTVTSVACDGDVEIRVSTGKAELTDVSCQSLISSGSTGDISLYNVLATQSFSVRRSTGDVKLDGCDAAEIFVETDTGDVRGTLLSDKVFIVNTDTGEKDVPKTTTGGRCEITTDTGDIRIRIQE